MASYLLISRKSRRFVIAALLGAAFAPTAAHAQWELTPASAAANWKISELTTNLPTGGYLPFTDNGYANLYGFAFGVSSKYNGGKPYVMIAEATNNVNNVTYNSNGLVVLKSDADGQKVGPALTPLQLALGLTSVGGNVYGAFPSEGVIMQVNPDGTVGHSYGAGLSTVSGLCVNPTNGHILAVSYGGPEVLDVNPVTGTVQTLMVMGNSNGASGIATDGVSIFTNSQVKSDGGASHIVQFAIPKTEGTTVTALNDYGFIYGAVGIALGSGGYIYVNCHHGQVYQINKNSKAISLLANWYAGWHDGFYLSPDPINGSLLVGGINIGRLTPPPGLSLQFATPTLPSTALATGKQITATIYLAVPAPVDFKVTLTPTSNFTLSANTVTIKAGTTSTTVTLTGAKVSAAQAGSLGATISLPTGTVTETATLTVSP